MIERDVAAVVGSGGLGVVVVGHVASGSEAAAAPPLLLLAALTKLEARQRLAAVRVGAIRIIIIIVIVVVARHVQRQYASRRSALQERRAPVVEAVAFVQRTAWRRRVSALVRPRAGVRHHKLGTATSAQAGGAGGGRVQRALVQRRRETRAHGRTTGRARRRSARRVRTTRRARHARQRVERCVVAGHARTGQHARGGGVVLRAELTSPWQ
mmetsp:Transcript_5521/g.9231  ORF Transcript_5521/g.9231 Transcript_5521/m.9231 type:complete len:212 (-) Transcript_5521:567-1202(-)